MLFAVAMSFLCAAIFSLAAHADFNVNKRRDTVLLNNGEKVVGVIVMVSKRGVLIVVPDPEEEDKAEQKFIPASRIKKIIRGKKSRKIEGFATGEKEAEKVVVGVGFKASSGGKTASPGSGPLKGPTGPSSSWRSAPSPRPKPTTGGNAAFPGKRLLELYGVRFPEFGRSAVLLFGAGGAEHLLDAAQSGDPAAEKQVRPVLDGVLRARVKRDEEISESPTGKKWTKRNKRRDMRRIILEKHRKLRSDRKLER